MARDDRFKKVSGAGADFLETARAKAEDFLRELSRAGGDTQGRAQEALDDLVVGGRRSTEQIVSAIRKEIQGQLGALGLATKADLQSLERRLSGRSATATAGAGRATTTRKASAGSTRTARKAAGTAKKAATGTTRKAAGATKKAAGTTKKAAGTTKKAAGTAGRATARRATATKKAAG